MTIYKNEILFRTWNQVCVILWKYIKSERISHQLSATVELSLVGLENKLYAMVIDSSIEIFMLGFYRVSRVQISHHDELYLTTL